MKGNKRSDTIAISRKAMPCDAYYLSPLLHKGSNIFNIANLAKIIDIRCDKCPIGHDNQRSAMFLLNILTFGGIGGTFSLTDHFNASIFAMVESGNMSMP